MRLTASREHRHTGAAVRRLWKWPLLTSLSVPSDLTLYWVLSTSVHHWLSFVNTRAPSVEVPISPACSLVSARMEVFHLRWVWLLFSFDGSLLMDLPFHSVWAEHVHVDLSGGGLWACDGDDRKFISKAHDLFHCSSFMSDSMISTHSCSELTNSFSTFGIKI